MSAARHTIEIDRVVFRGIDLSRERARRIRALLEVELGARWNAASVGSECLPARSVPRIDASGPDLAVGQGDRQLAAGLGERIAQTLGRLR
jgi:hypothetical protein